MSSPKIYHFDQHLIIPEKIDRHAVEIIQRLQDAGFTAYLVGGGVRDLLLQQRPKDFDVSTDAKPEQIRSLFRNALLIGRRFRLAHIRFGKKIIEVSTFRAGDPDSAALIVRDNVWGSEQEDALRRDFTINGLFYDPKTQTIIDYIEGFPDIEKKLLRTIGQPQKRFIQDPVRMIRLLKFCARFNFDIDPPTHEALLECRNAIIHSSEARILEELLRMLESGSAAPFFQLLHQYGLLKLLLPPIAYFMDLDPNQMIFKMLQELDSYTRKTFPETPNRAVLVGALCWPILELTIQHAQKEQGPLRFGKIAKETYLLLELLFNSFLKLPRRLFEDTLQVLTLQCRFTPPDEDLPQHLRWPSGGNSQLALQLFQLRCNLNPELTPLYTRWAEASFNHASEGPQVSEVSESHHRRPRRRRRRHPTSLQEQRAEDRER